MKSSFSKKLLEWYNPTHRNLPWKKTGDAYKIWLSEIILQQTRVEQGIPYYLAFIKTFPTVKKLGNAPLDKVLKLWEGLGYYSRARNLHIAAKQVMETHKGKFPATYEEIIQLKGIGNYTAAAISSFAFKLPHAVVDGNVYRVLSRIYGIETPIDSTIGKKQFEQLAQQILDKKNPDLHNQAIMDLGATICKPKQPICQECPFSSECHAFQQDKIEVLPVKAKKLLKKARYFHYFVFSDAKHIYIQQRWGNDIWKGLFEFPMIETKDPKPAFNSKKIVENIGISNQFILNSKQRLAYKQTLSHQNIHAFFYEIKLSALPKPEKPLLNITLKNIQEYAFPKIIRSYLLDRLNFLS